MTWLRRNLNPPYYRAAVAALSVGAAALAVLGWAEVQALKQRPCVEVPRVVYTQERSR